jgi:ABC-type glycerol-3-phosphate transport system substrate-binding protein
MAAPKYFKKNKISVQAEQVSDTAKRAETAESTIDAMIREGNLPDLMTVSNMLKFLKKSPGVNLKQVTRDKSRVDATILALVGKQLKDGGRSTEDGLKVMEALRKKLGR